MYEMYVTLITESVIHIFENNFVTRASNNEQVTQ